MCVSSVMLTGLMQMRPLAQAGQCHGMRAMAGAHQGVADAPPAPGAMPGTMNKNESSPSDDLAFLQLADSGRPE
jgi:hypothetical protein